MRRPKLTPNVPEEGKIRLTPNLMLSPKCRARLAAVAVARQVREGVIIDEILEEATNSPEFKKKLADLL